MSECACVCVCVSVLVCVHLTHSVIQDNPVLHLTATTSGVVAPTDGTEHDDNLYMPEDFFEGIKGVRYSHYGQYISGYADTFEELLTVLDRHAQVGGGEGEGRGSTMEAEEELGPY